MLDKEIILTYKQYISERANSIIYSLSNNERVLIYAPMKGGKTHLIINNIKEHYNKLGIRVIVVSPVTLLIDQQEARAKGDSWGAYYSKNKCSLDTTNIITTPDSLPTILEAVQEANNPYILVIDEAHEEESSRTFRKSFKNIEQGANNSLCEGVAYLTATPQGLERSSLDKFDKYIKLKQELTLGGKDNPHIFKHAKELIIKDITLNIGDIIKLIERERANNPKSPIVIKLDNKELLKSLQAYCNRNDINYRYLASNIKVEEGDEYGEQVVASANQLRADITSYKDIIGQEGEILAFTSLINSGIEINNNPNTIFINFTNGTYNYTNEIQSIGRFRNGLSKIIITVPKRDTPKEQEEAQEPTIREYQDIYKEELKVVQASKQYLESVLFLGEQGKSRIAHTLDKEQALSVDDNNKVLIDIDTIKAIANRDYEAQFKESPKLLLEHFKATSGLNIDKYSLDLGDLEAGDKLEQEIGATQDLRALSKEILDKREQDLKDDLAQLQEGTLELIATNNPIELGANDIKILEEYNLLSKSIKTIKGTIEELTTCEEISKGRAISLYATKSKGELKDILRANKLKLIIQDYNDNKKSLIALGHKGRKGDRLEIIRAIATLDYFTGDRNIKNGDKLTKSDLIAVIKIGINKGVPLYTKYDQEQDDKKKRALEKRVIKDATRYIELLLKTSRDKLGKLRYSSQRKDIKDLI